MNYGILVADVTVSVRQSFRVEKLPEFQHAILDKFIE